MDWFAVIFEDMYHGLGGLAEWTKNSLGFIPNLRMINGIAKTLLGGGGITSEDVTPRVMWDNVGHEVCPTSHRSGPAPTQYRPVEAYEAACANFGT